MACVYATPPHCFLVLITFASTLGLVSCQACYNDPAICPARDSYCGQSLVPAANWNDGSGCACMWGYTYTSTVQPSGGHCHNDGPQCCFGMKGGCLSTSTGTCSSRSTAKTCAEGSIPCDELCLDNGNICEEGCKMEDGTSSHCYCGQSQIPAANWNDGSGCSCKWNYTYTLDLQPNGGHCHNTGTQCCFGMKGACLSTKTESCVSRDADGGCPTGSVSCET